MDTLLPEIIPTTGAHRQIIYISRTSLQTSIIYRILSS